MIALLASFITIFGIAMVLVWFFFWFWTRDPLGYTPEFVGWIAIYGLGMLASGVLLQVWL